MECCRGSTISKANFPTGSDDGARLHALDGFRGVLSLSVAYFHFNVWPGTHFPGWLVNLQPLLDFFFLLSGFVLAMIYGERITGVVSMIDFLIRRAGRLWPVHLATLAFLLLWQLARVSGSYILDRPHMRDLGPNWSAQGFAENVFLVQAWGIDKRFTWNFPSWTLSTELIAYIALGVLLLLVLQPTVRLGIAMVIAGLSWWQFGYATEFWNILPEISVTWCLKGFFLGYVTHYIWQRWPTRPTGHSTVLELAAFLGCIGLMAARVNSPIELAIWTVCSAGLIYALASGRGLLSSLLARKPMRWLGEISLSTYMVHYPVLIVMFSILSALHRQGVLPEMRSPAPATLRDLLNFGAHAYTAAYLGLVVVVGAVVHRWIEMPGRTYSIRLAKHLSKSRAGAGRLKVPGIH